MWSDYSRLTVAARNYAGSAQFGVHLKQGSRQLSIDKGLAWRNDDPEDPKLDISFHLGNEKQRELRFLEKH